MEEYDDYYEEEEQDEYAEEENEEEEERKPSVEELEYLELRKQIKEQIRRKKQRENGSAFSKSKENNKQPIDNYGSFFGPSRPVIAQRVIQESKSLLENPRMAVRVVNGYHTGSMDHKNSSTTKSSRNGTHEKLSRGQNEVKRKVQKLKDTRDYSFLLSDDVEAPASREPRPQSASTPKSEMRSTEVPQRIKQLSGSSGRNVPGGREERKAISVNGQMHSKTGSSKTPSSSKSNAVPMDSRRHLSSNNGKPLSRCAGPKVFPSSAFVASAKKKNATPLGKNSLPATCKQQNSLPTTHKQQNSLPATHKQQNSLPATHKQQNSLPATHKQQNSLPATHKQQNSLPATHKQQNSLPAMHKQPFRMQSSVANQGFEQRKPIQEHKAKVIPKQQLTSSKPQMRQPVKQVSSHALRDDNRPKKRPARPFSDDEDEMALNMIRSMFNTHRFAGRDDDDSDMEANYDDIMREERRSALIARKEDEEQLRLIEEEERRERMRKMAKKRKHGQ